MLEGLRDVDRYRQERDMWRERAERAEARAEELEAEDRWGEETARRAESAEQRLSDAVELLWASRAEIDRHGHGDFHYGAMARDKGVLAALAAIDAFLASLAPVTPSALLGDPTNQWACCCVGEWERTNAVNPACPIHVTPSAPEKGS